MTGTAQWLMNLDSLNGTSTEDGLVFVQFYVNSGRPPEEVVAVEKAASYGAHAVFFEAGRNGGPPTPQAFVFVSDGPADDPAFGKLHQQLWSWGGVPLLYRKTPGLVQLFRCAHMPDFVSSSGETVCKPVKTLNVAAAVSLDLSEQPWWDASRLRNGTLWDDPAVCSTMLSVGQAAHKGLIDAVKELNTQLNEEGVLKKLLRRKLLILSLLIAYLEERGVFPADYFGQFAKGATRFFEVLANGKALVALLDALEERFNGNVFTLTDEDRQTLRTATQLARFAKLVKGRQDASGQLTLWQLYSFRDLPVELISHIYQLFVTDADSSVYTPPFLVRLMLGETLSWERLDRLDRSNEIILDPSCGSGVFLVEAYKRLVLHWRKRNDWKKPTITVLRALLKRVHGIDLEKGAVELAAFSLCLALCDALEPEAIRSSIKLFPLLAGRSVHHTCFFEAKEKGLVKESVGVIIGNPPFETQLTTAGAKRSYENYTKQHGRLPGKQLAYLFLHDAMNMVADGGVLCLLQQYNLLYNEKSLAFRRQFFTTWDVREVLDFISVRGLFVQGKADTKVVVMVAESRKPPHDRKILHATFRRSGRVVAEQGFDIDYYDLHWLPRNLVLHNDRVWRSNLLGGGRVLAFVERLREFRTLGDFISEKSGWHDGDGFLEGKEVKTPDHIIGKDLLPPSAITLDGIDTNAIAKFDRKPVQRARTEDQFKPPMLLIRKIMTLPHSLWEKSYLTYKDEIFGISAPESSTSELKDIDAWVTSSKAELEAYCACISTRLFSRKATAVSAHDIRALPYPPSRDLEMSVNENILVKDIIEYYRELVRLGDGAAAMKQKGHEALSEFSRVFSRQIGTVYKKNPIRPVEACSWPGVICQPFIFGSGTVDWNGADELVGKLNTLLKEQRDESLHVTRICRIYDGKCVFLVKPDRLRYWLPSVALRDADEALSDLRAQGF